MSLFFAAWLFTSVDRWNLSFRLSFVHRHLYLDSLLSRAQSLLTNQWDGSSSRCDARRNLRWWSKWKTEVFGSFSPCIPYIFVVDCQATTDLNMLKHRATPRRSFRGILTTSEIFPIRILLTRYLSITSRIIFFLNAHRSDD